MISRKVIRAQVQAQVQARSDGVGMCLLSLDKEIWHDNGMDSIFPAWKMGVPRSFPNNFVGHEENLRTK